MTDLAKRIDEFLRTLARPIRITDLRDELGYPVDPEATREFQMAMTELHMQGKLEFYERHETDPLTGGAVHRIWVHHRRASGWRTHEPFAPLPRMPFEQPRLR